MMLLSHAIVILLVFNLLGVSAAVNVEDQNAQETTTTTTTPTCENPYKSAPDPYDAATRDESKVRRGRMGGKVCLVTGGTSGLGMDASLHLASEGCSVVLTGRREGQGNAVVDLIKQRGGEATFVQADVTKEEDCERMVQTAVEKYGKIDAAFNNAGISRKHMLPLHEVPLDEWRNVLSVNLDGVFLSMKYEIQAMLNNWTTSGGSIVNCGSVYSFHGFPGMAVYSASKHALTGLTKSAAHEYAKYNIRINNVNPGYTPSDMTAPGIALPALGDFMGRLHPGERWVRPEEVSSAVAWLASDDSSYTSGVSLEVSSGISASYIPPSLWTKGIGNAMAEAMGEKEPECEA